MNPEKWVFNAIILLPFLFLGSGTSIDTITPNQSIKDGEILVSDGETFALGFFSPGNGTSNRRYVGIWYYKISEQTVVWVANRDNPINGTSGAMSVNQDGNLVIYDDITQNVTSILWQTNVSAEVATNSFYSARLLDSGNLVLSQGSSDISSSVVLWQSFDCPTNTMLPNMKLGLDRRTGQYQFLTSWKSRDDPGSGEYFYRMDPRATPQAFFNKGPTRLWRTGPWIGDKWSGIMSANFIMNGRYIDNNEELSVMYSLVNASLISLLFVDESGYIKASTWNEDNAKWVSFWSAPKDECDYYGQCGPYGNCDPNNGGAFECTCLPGYEPRSAQDWNLQDGSGGCKRKRGETIATCSNGEGFVKVASVKVPDTSGMARSEMNTSKEACEDKCLRNCSCSAYTSGGGGICITWYGNLTDTRVLSNGGLDLYVRVDAIELAQQYSKKARSLHGKIVAIVVTSVVVISLLIIISLVYWLVIIKRRRGDNSDEETLELPIFEMVTISRATNKFCDTNKIGEGGFGSVYKGLLSTGKEIAVKRLSTSSKQGLNEFKSEVTLIAKLQHRNLVRLLGCCIHGEERMLIYEYMPNGSLDSLIFGVESTSKSLTWRRRLDIIVGIAQGVLYLHRDSRLRIIHRDLKASNVLLDCEMNPKISDFGLARTFGGDQSSARTSRVVGTYGYMSPEYAIDGLFSMKSDVFSFGVMVLEILSGKSNRRFHHPDHDFNLLGHAWTLWIEGKACELLDSLVEGSFSMSEVLRCIQIGLLCVQKCPEDRPTMSTVLLMLITEAIVLPQPNQPGFYMERKSSDTNNLLAQSNEMTMSQVEPR
ncbi:hypothetical protein ACSBR1_038096 [Camellia fascicularis]